MSQIHLIPGYRIFLHERIAQGKFGSMGVPRDQWQVNVMWCMLSRQHGKRIVWRSRTLMLRSAPVVNCAVTWAASCLNPESPSVAE